ncbi:MAG: hypothetical protein AB1405_00440 [Bdellovibrionota bacterium]
MTLAGDSIRFNAQGLPSKSMNAATDTVYIRYVDDYGVAGGGDLGMEKARAIILRTIGKPLLWKISGDNWQPVGT